MGLRIGVEELTVADSAAEGDVLQSLIQGELTVRFFLVPAPYDLEIDVFDLCCCAQQRLDPFIWAQLADEQHSETVGLWCLVAVPVGIHAPWHNGDALRRDIAAKIA